MTDFGHHSGAGLLGARCPGVGLPLKNGEFCIPMRDAYLSGEWMTHGFILRIKVDRSAEYYCNPPGVGEATGFFMALLFPA